MVFPKLNFCVSNNTIKLLLLFEVTKENFLTIFSFDVITEETIKMQIQYIFENDLFFKGLFSLKQWAG